MNKEKNWMLMTYYCPTHGDAGLIEPVVITNVEIRKIFSRKGKTSRK